MITALRHPNYWCLWEKQILTRTNGTVTWTACEAITFSRILAGKEDSAWPSALPHKSVCHWLCPQHRPLHLSPSSLFLLPTLWLTLTPRHACLVPCAPCQLSEPSRTIWNQPRVAHSHLLPRHPTAPMVNCTMCLSILALLSTFFLYMCLFPIDYHHVSSLASFYKWPLSLL